MPGPSMRAGKQHHEKQHQPLDFDAINTFLVSPELIRSSSHGEVKSHETINYRTFKPARDGLFCTAIFGSIKDDECRCGKYKGIKHRGVVCKKCGTEVTLSGVRNERMGHIDLTVPVANIGSLTSGPSRIGLMLDMDPQDIERILHFKAYVVLDPGSTPMHRGQLLDESQYLAAINEHGHRAHGRPKRDRALTAGIGAEAVHELLRSMDLSAESARLRDEMATTHSKTRLKHLAERIKLIEMFRASGDRPEWMVMTVLPVCPPGRRPLVLSWNDKHCTTHVLNTRYCRIITFNNRLRRLIELKAPECLVHHEKRKLQEAVDALFDHGIAIKPSPAPTAPRLH